VPWYVPVAACLLALYAAFVAALIVAGKREGTARDIARFVPDCAVLIKRLLRDPRVPRRHKLLLTALVGYLALPFDLVPDMIPVAGQLDDVLIVVLVLRALLKDTEHDLLHEHWPGSQGALAFVLKYAG
jgi:uncharacterized membrane protein YkvA (DUF1232 family)